MCSCHSYPTQCSILVYLYSAHIFKHHLPFSLLLLSMVLLMMIDYDDDDDDGR